MVSINGQSKGNVCQKRSYYDSYNRISSQTGEKICQKVGYDLLENIDRLGDDVYGKYSFVSSYYSRLYYLRLNPSGEDFDYSISSSCYERSYYTFISCSCGAGFYNSTEGCLKCPAGSSSPPHSPICHCPAGTHWTRGYCKQCPANTYSPANSTECTQCPTGAHSRPGSEVCLCGDGLRMTGEGQCEACASGNYSYTDSNTCSECPVGSTSVSPQGFCTCPAGMRWEFNLSGVLPPEQGQPYGGITPEQQAGYCVDCEPNSYSKVNSTQCSDCPCHSYSPSKSHRCFCEPGFRWVEVNITSNHTDLNNTTHHTTPHHNTTHNTTTHNTTHLLDYCDICPENHYSKYGAVNCTQCPHFKASTPGSEYCYRCTLGEYWENHTCVQCPAHLYGDGVHCNKCPDGFEVLRGFCYRSAREEGDDGGHTEKVVNEVASSSTASYFGAVFTTVLLYFGYSKREVLKNILNELRVSLLGLRVSVNGTVQEGVQVNVGFTDLRGRHGEREVGSQEEDEEDKEEEDLMEDEDQGLCFQAPPTLEIEEHVYSE
ncbi:hypothetical protein ACHWQZ_G018437 [Mnemiopsis leidyi]